MPYVIDGFVPWLFLPDWSKGVTESLAWSTKILGPSYTGVRQKRMMRLAPRRSFEFDIATENDSFRLSNNLLFGQGKREWMLPVWQDRQSIGSTANYGDEEVMCLTVGYDFQDALFGQATHALLCKNEFNPSEFEVVEILAATLDRITLVNPLEHTWPVGSYLYPLRRAILSNFPSAVLPTNRVSSNRVRFDLVEPCDWGSYEFPDTYLGRPVWERGNDWRVAPSLGFNRVINTVDNDTSIPVNFDLPDKAFMSFSSALTAYGRAEHAELRSILYSLAGRFKSIWLPTLLQDLQMAANISSGSTALTVRNCGYTIFGRQQAGRRDVRIELFDGTRFYRRITNSIESGDNEVLTLSSSLGQNVAAAQVRRISFMSLAQQASDSIDLTHPTDADGATTCSIVFEGVIEPPAE